MAVSAIVSVVVAAVSAYLQYEQAQAQAAAMRYNAKVAENQAIGAQQQAQYVADRQREQTRRLLSRQRALYGTAGVELAAGSPLMVQADSARQGELDAQASLASGAGRALGFQSQAKIDRFMAGRTETMGSIKAGATLLSGFVEGYGKYRTSTSGNTITVPSQSVQAY